MNPIIRNRHRRLAVAIDAGLPGTRCHRSGSLALFAGLTALGLALGYSSSVAAVSVYVVNTAGDPGPAGTTSLRQAVAQANLSSGSVVQFDASLVGSTITLANGEIAFNKHMTIEGPGAGKLTISGNNASRIFNFNGVFGDQTPVTINGLTLTRGNAFSASGGAIYSYGASLTLTNLVISASKAKNGGGLAVVGAYAYLLGSRVSGNYATTSGGGIAAINSYRLVVNASTISGNTANGYGGGVFADGLKSVGVNQSLISGNTVPLPGGPGIIQGGGGIALKNVTSYASIINSTVSGNSAYAPGGGIGIFDASTGNASSCYFSTISGNYAGGAGSNGIYALGKPHIYSCIVANNFTRQDNTDLVGTFAATDSLIKTPGTATLSGTGNIIGQDPLLGQLADNGGPTLSMLPALTSPALDRGQPNTPSVTTDQRGSPRPAGAGKDMGAVERQYPEDLIFRNGFDPP